MVEITRILIVDDDPREKRGRAMYVGWLKDIFDHEMNREFSVEVLEADSAITLESVLQKLNSDDTIDLMLLDQRFTTWSKDPAGELQPGDPVGVQGDAILDSYSDDPRISRIVMLSWVERPGDLLKLERARVTEGALEFWTKLGLDKLTFRQQIETILRLPSRFDLAYFERAYETVAGSPSIWEVEDDLRGAIIGSSQEILRVRSQVCEAALSDIPVLITGETGTGKGLIAEAIHRISARGTSRGFPKPYALNCAEFLEEGLLRTELFGAKRGAYTGRDDDKPGRLFEADESTLFLDEVGLASERLQGVLLRALEDQSATPVGGTVEDRYRFDVRFIAATDQDIHSATTFSMAFRHRLSGLSIELAPLRSRGDEDIRMLAELFLAEADPTPRLTFAAWRVLFEYDWPGNVRQLRFVMSVLKERCRLTGQTTIHVHDVQRLLPKDTSSTVQKQGEGEELIKFVLAEGINYSTVSDRFLAWYVQRQHLFLSGGVRTNEAYRNTSEALGCSDTTVKNKLRDFRAWRERSQGNS